MELHDLRPNKGSTQKKKRVGRGIGSGMGKTSTRGHKGDKARGYVRPGFEGGQTPLYKRLPQLRGFTNIFRVEYQVVNVKDLEAFEAGAEITAQVLADAGLVRRNAQLVKILGDGELTKSLTIKVAKVTKSAQEKIIAAGGTVEVAG